MRLYYYDTEKWNKQVKLKSSWKELRVFFGDQSVLNITNIIVLISPLSSPQLESSSVWVFVCLFLVLFVHLCTPIFLNIYYVPIVSSIIGSFMLNCSWTHQNLRFYRLIVMLGQRHGSIMRYDNVLWMPSGENDVSWRRGCLSWVLQEEKQLALKAKKET